MSAVFKVEELARYISGSSKLVTAQAPLDGEEVGEHSPQDDEEHHRGDSGPHIGITELELVPEKGTVEEGAQNVGREVGSGKRSLHGVDQVEGVEIADEGEDRADADGRQDEGQLDFPELGQAG